MKFTANLKNQIILITLFALISSVILFSKNNEENLKEDKPKDKKVEKKVVKKPAPKSRLSSETNTAAPKPPKISDKAYNILNNTLVGPNDIPQKGIELKTRKWDFKMMTKQVEDLTVDMNFADMKGVSEKSFRSFQYNFITPFEKCDVDVDSLLNLKEFTKCLKTDPYLNRISIPDTKFPLQGSTIKFKNFDEYAKILYGIYDDSRMGKMNFYNYMQIRLFTFSWMKCSTGSPFIEEANFECAMEKAAGWKTMQRNQARALFENALSFSGSVNREMDFVIFSDLALSVRLYGKINRKEDNVANKNEMDLALDNNILPERFNQKTIEYLFTLSNDSSNGNSLGIDLISFCFYDFWLKIFDENARAVRFNLNIAEFIKANNHALFPAGMKGSIKLIPQNVLSSASYNMFEDLNKNMKPEDNHFMKSFLQSNEQKKKENEQWSLEQARGKNAKLAYNEKNTLTNIFNILDSEMIGKINFYDFGAFIQMLHIFTKNDPNNAKGRLVAGLLEKEITGYKGYPIMSKTLLARSKRLKLINTDLYMDFASLLFMMRIEDIVPSHVRRMDKTQMTEIELKNILSHVNRKFIPDSHIKHCLRSSPDADKSIPVYDWECAFTNTESSTLKFYENSFDYLTSLARKMKLGPTEFNNKDFGLP